MATATLRSSPSSETSPATRSCGSRPPGAAVAQLHRGLDAAGAVDTAEQRVEGRRGRCSCAARLAAGGRERGRVADARRPRDRHRPAASSAGSRPRKARSAPSSNSKSTRSARRCATQRRRSTAASRSGGGSATARVGWRRGNRRLRNSGGGSWGGGGGSGSGPAAAGPSRGDWPVGRPDSGGAVLLTSLRSR